MHIQITTLQTEKPIVPTFTDKPIPPANTSSFFSVLGHLPHYFPMIRRFFDAGL